MLKIIMVRLVGPKNECYTYALIDDGSTVSMIESGLAKELGASGPKNSLKLLGIGGQEMLCHGGENVAFELCSCQNESKHALTNVRTITNLNLPAQTLRQRDLEGWQHLQGIPFHEYIDAKPRLFIHGYVAGGTNRSRGFVHCNSTSEQQSLEANTGYDDSLLHLLVKSSFQLDAIGVSNLTRKKTMDKRAEQLLDDNTKYIGDAWQTGLLWKHDEITLPVSKENALRLAVALAIKRKISRNPEFGELYRREIRHLLDQGYARKVGKKEETEGRVWYLPHFGVTSSSKPGKLRVVFDAARR